jgi:hypothetical protein
MLGFKDLFSKAWDSLYPVFTVYALYVGLAILGLVLAACGTFISYSISGELGGIIAGGFLGLPTLGAIIFGGLWMSLATIYAAQNTKANHKICYKKTRSLIVPFFILGLTMCALVLGYMAFLAVPGIIFGMYFMFAANILVKEKADFFDAILRSRAYIKGYAWPVFWRLFLCFLGGSILSSIPKLGTLISIGLITPFQIAFTNTIYEDLRRIKKGKPGKPAPGTGSLYVKWAAAGWVLALLVGVICIVKFHPF